MVCGHVRPPKTESRRFCNDVLRAQPADNNGSAVHLWAFCGLGVATIVTSAKRTAFLIQRRLII